MMHTNLSVTDGVYGILSNLDVKNKISGLGNKKAQPKTDQDELKALVRQILSEL
jgi:hypothetical protein